MGLSFHYKGRLKNASDLPALITEVSEIAKVHQWESFVFESEFPNNSFSEEIDFENLFGIMVSAEKCEPLCFSFLQNGRMCGLINFNVIQINSILDEDLAYQLATKTQYAGDTIHKQLILLMDYISKKYLADFECVDEGQYWETRDDEVLKATFERYSGVIDSLTSTLEHIPTLEGESIEDYILRMAEIVKNKNHE